MSRDIVIEVVALYWPISLVILLAFCLKPNPRIWAAAMMATAWVAAVLPWVNMWALSLGLWTFDGVAWNIIGMPASFYCGWVVLWGIGAVFLQSLYAKHGSSLVGLWLVLLVMLIVDLFAMPMMAPVLILTDRWLLGELLLIFIVLFPSLFLARWVIEDRCVAGRASLIAIAFVLLVMGVMPLGAEGKNIADIFDSMGERNHLLNWILIAAISLAGLPALAAVRQFVVTGKGTPIPFDPPKKLVSQGVFAYIANPMQTSMLIVLLLWACLLHSWVSVALAIVSVIYAQGIAAWSETADLKTRYGESWNRYRKSVPRWRYSLLPYVSEEQRNNPAVLYVSERCGICRELAAWIRCKSPDGMVLSTAEDYPGGGLERITYVYSEENIQVSGVNAVACAFQHLHLGWAYLGWIMQLPGVAQILQLSMDASGAGKMEVKSSCGSD